ncbi:MAG: hypothetical protein A3E98_01530 [Candidatus Doudnabacteria bacterium RIFCSPHIGHO2_12_FULL_48_11]|uniref:Uncharacterized protein n=1 Tax=Candidatus Doudnabacteria bacterium RIFCSPHIGHO2_01_FULL_46_24 TaxID=1817825 RepID=A0A1F5NW32_9BACT|nr:MAG: hypothetical protein A2720_00110 [Candidatus Doudnabacteria bacterium RIFCSPHIGHO2_01_FULL_46_24]OGE95510.1 MAG: hypothetical protein A3E98_01530 [Candidatus Doudnabacteria bacterium RIFCSPHIGHO2_12_FULL_48_11]
MKNKFILSICLVLLGLTVFSFVAAQGETGLVPCGQRGSNNECTLPHLVVLTMRVINFFVGISWIVAMFFMFWGSYGMVAAYGNQEKLTEAKGTFKDAVIGFFLIIIAFLLINFTVLAMTGKNFNQIMEFLPKPPASTSVLPFPQAFAATCDPGNISSELCNPIGETKDGQGRVVSPAPETLVALAIKMIFIFAGFTSLIPIVAMAFAGFAMVTSQGDSEGITRAKTAFKWTVYGFIMAVLSFVLTNAMMHLLGVGTLPDPNNPQGLAIDNPLATDDFVVFVKSWLERFLQVVGLIAVLMLVFNGFRYITAGGEEEQTTQAKNAMKWVAAGILTILLSYVIIKAAGALLGLS